MLITPGHREAERKVQGLKFGKGNSSKLNETQVFLTLGYSNWTICSLFNRFCPKIVILFTQPPIINHFLLPQREERRKEQGLKIGKGNSPKLNDMQGFLTLGYSNWTICNQLS